MYMMQGEGLKIQARARIQTRELSCFSLWKAARGAPDPKEWFSEGLGGSIEVVQPGAFLRHRILSWWSFAVLTMHASGYPSSDDAHF
jgi:hypothetical protein